MEEELILQDELIYYAHVLSPKFTSLKVIPISDVHYGNPLFSKKHFIETVREIKDTPNCVTFLNGDLCESVIRTSKGEIFKQVGTPQDQRDWIIKTLLPIKKKILGVTIGNHEIRIANDVGIDLCKDIATALNAPYRASGMLVKISFGSGNESHADRSYTYWGYFTHGYGGARTKAAKAVKVERTSTFLHADFYVMSHDHVVNVADDVYLQADPRTHLEKKNGEFTGFTIGGVMEHRKMLIKTGAFVKFGGYAEMGGFSPSGLHQVSIKLSGTGKRMVKLEL